MRRLASALALALVAPVGGGAQAAEDERASPIADRVLEAAGGREGLEAIGALSWRSINGRLLVWNPATDDVRIENEYIIILMNLASGEGRVWRYGVEMTDPGDVERALSFGYHAWQQDAREMLLPFMLHDPGVTLTYDGEGEVDGRDVDRLRVRFAGDPRSPAAEIRIHVERSSGRIVRWESYLRVGDATPAYTVPWSNHTAYGTIELSDDRGLKRHTDLEVFDQPPAEAFTSPEPVPWFADRIPSTGDGSR